MHAAEAAHGDMGVVSAGDVAVALSHSGETHEVLELIPRFKLLGVPVVALTGASASSLARLADCVIDVSVPFHEWPYGIIPTASSAAAVAVGDALAVCLLVMTNVRPEDFALLHPGGLLGRKMLVRVGDIMHTSAELPQVQASTPLRETLGVMTAGRLGVACVVDGASRLFGVITDGDLRRLLESRADPLKLTAGEAMTREPKSITADALTARAIYLMETHAITSLPVVDSGGALVGLLHMHDIMKLETGQ
ncbi:MAG: hypothetical protein A2139_14645 [Desulfobacca sp. RBG_16_60_12]|nr:MAG: hypothetical protein A2139_14645 [Desulfobacca sp. RBG_16_60_12]